MSPPPALTSLFQIAPKMRAFVTNPEELAASEAGLARQRTSSPPPAGPENSAPLAQRAAPAEAGGLLAVEHWREAPLPQSAAMRRGVQMWRPPAPRLSPRPLPPGELPALSAALAMGQPAQPAGHFEDCPQWRQRLQELVETIARGALPTSLAPLLVLPQSRTLADVGERVRYGCALHFAEACLHTILTERGADPDALARHALSREFYAAPSSRQVWDYIREQDVAGRRIDQAGFRSLWRLCDEPQAPPPFADGPSLGAQAWELHHRTLPRKAAQFLFEAAVETQRWPLANQALWLFLRQLQSKSAAEGFDADCCCIKPLLQWSRSPASELRHVVLPDQVSVSRVMSSGLVLPSKTAWPRLQLLGHILARPGPVLLAPAVARRYAAELANSGRILAPALVEPYVELLSSFGRAAGETFMVRLALTALRVAAAEEKMQLPVLFAGAEAYLKAEQVTRLAKTGTLVRCLLAAPPAPLAAVYQVAQLALLGRSADVVFSFIRQAGAPWREHPWVEEALLSAMLVYGPSKAACRELATWRERPKRSLSPRLLAPLLAWASAQCKGHQGQAGSSPTGADAALAGGGSSGSSGSNANEGLDAGVGNIAGEAEAAANEAMLFALLDTLAATTSNFCELTQPAVPAALHARWRAAQASAAAGALGPRGSDFAALHAAGGPQPNATAALRSLRS